MILRSEIDDDVSSENMAEAGRRKPYDSDHARRYFRNRRRINSNRCPIKLSQTFEHNSCVVRHDDMRGSVGFDKVSHSTSSPDDMIQFGCLVFAVNAHKSDEPEAVEERDHCSVPDRDHYLAATQVRSEQSAEWAVRPSHDFTPAAIVCKAGCNRSIGRHSWTPAFGRPRRGPCPANLQTPRPAHSGRQPNRAGCSNAANQALRSDRLQPALCGRSCEAQRQLCCSRKISRPLYPKRSFC